MLTAFWWLVAGGWLWFINLFNFMDGIDGLAATETICICVGFLLAGNLVGLNDVWLLLAILIFGSVIGFLYFNWYPAKVIMGDVGSIPLGFLLGWLLIQLSLEGHLFTALILPIYFLADATVTLLKRIYNREMFWMPHRKHFYQVPAVVGVQHSHIVSKIIVANIFIVASAIAAIHIPILGVLFAVCVVSALLFALQR